ncbi:hypothetical protein PPROV_000010100 [Pycnococcus provasolii]|uniref:Uncharacterized protein n=1 Tax=Pycnococcus provasolii TaxID=41880 RepID=A0A830H2J4_9CHLO|nr:hypothetical protein PPROV_000010100 [Pycnococcus provasolii]
MASPGHQAATPTGVELSAVRYLSGGLFMVVAVVLPIVAILLKKTNLLASSAAAEVSTTCSAPLTASQAEINAFGSRIHTHGDNSGIWTLEAEDETSSAKPLPSHFQDIVVKSMCSKVNGSASPRRSA